MPRKATPFAVTPEIAEAVRMYQGGATGKQVSQYLGVSTFTAVRTLRKAGVEIRTRGYRTDSDPPPPAHIHPQQIASYEAYPPVTPEYLTILNDRWSRRIPAIVRKALKESGLLPTAKMEMPNGEEDA